MEYEFSNQIDSTLVKMVLNSVQDGDINVIKSNVEKYHLNMNLLIDKENHQNAFFYCALVKEDIDALNICKYLVQLGVDSKLKDKHQQTCLYYTVREGKYLTSKYLIEECGLPINEKDIYGQNPIYYAAREGRLNLCELLVQKGTDVNLEDKYGQTCIFYAIRQGHKELVEYLIKNGANVNKVDKKRQNPVSYANKVGQTEIMNLLMCHGGIRLERNKQKSTKETVKKNSPKTEEELKQEKINLINSVQVPKKFVLVKIGPEGEKTPVTEEEFNEFKLKNEDIVNTLNNPELLQKMVDDINDDDMKLVEAWETSAKKLMNTLWKVKDAEWFQKPVDPVGMGVPDYFNVIKHPMDFSTVKKKLNNNTYINVREFCDDMDLIFNNCITYNGANSFIGNIANKIQEEYKKLFKEHKLEKFL